MRAAPGCTCQKPRADTEALAQRGHRVHFITYNQPVRLDFFNENLFYHEVYIPTYPLFQFPPYESALATKMVYITQNEKLDVLHVHFGTESYDLAHLRRVVDAARAARLPIVHTVHDLVNPQLVDQEPHLAHLGLLVAEADELAAAIVFLLSSDASFVTGTLLVVDGGETSL